MVMNTNTQRESGRATQLANIQAAKVFKFCKEPFLRFFIFSNIFKKFRLSLKL